MISDISLYEATFTGFIESKGISSRIPEFFILEKLEGFNELFQESEPVGFRLRGVNPSSPGWFDLHLDSAITRNPNLCFLRFILRYDDYKKYKNFPDTIKKIVEVLG